MTDDEYAKQLCRRFNAGEPFKYMFFWGHQKKKGEVTASCFSQWYEASFEVDGEPFATAEHYMMAQKAKLFEDFDTRAQILCAPNPGAAKALGRGVRNFNEALWVQHRFEIVCRANEAKFAQNEQLRDFLVRSGSRILVEASPVDLVWGIGLAGDDARANNPNLWRGLNLLGFALMQVRNNMSK